MNQQDTQNANFVPNEVCKLLNFIQKHASEDSDELSSIVLKLGLKSVAKKPQAPIRQENILKFTKKETDSMSEPVKILLIYSGYEIKYRIIKNTYQVRFRRDGYNIELCAKDLSTLKTRFLAAVERAVPHRKPITPLLKDYLNEWLAIKKTTVKEITLKGYTDIINAHILPPFGDKHLDEITRADVQNYLSELVNQEKYRTAEKLKVQLKAIFDVAVSDYNFKSPMEKVVLAEYEVKKGKSLTVSEEKTVVDYCIYIRKNPFAAQF